MNDLWNLMAEETKQSFSELQNLVLALDTKSSITIAIDAILLAALSLTPNFNHLHLIVRILILIPLFLSLAFAICCLYPREWNRIDGENLVEEYQEAKNPDYVACEISKTRADLERKLLKIYKSKFMHFQISTIFMIIASLEVFVLFIYLFLDLR